MILTVKLEILAWDVPDEELGLEPLKEDASLEEIVEHDFKIKQDLIKEQMDLPETVTLDIDYDDEYIEVKKGKKFASLSMIASIASYDIERNYGYGPTAIGDAEILNTDEIEVRD